MVNACGQMLPIEASIPSGEALRNTLVSDYPAELEIKSCRLHYRSIHDTYVVVSDNARFYFKVYRYGLRTREEVQAEVDLLVHLRDSGIRAMEPVAKRDGTFISEFTTIQGVRYGVLYTSVGARPYTEADETDALNEGFGRYISSIHNAWDEFPGSPARWHLDEGSFIDAPMQHIRDFAKLYPVDLPLLEQVAAQVKRGLLDLPRQKPEYGICHGDLYAGNVRLDEGGAPVLFDFDFCGHGWRAYDLCLYLNPFSWGCDLSKKDRLSRRREAFLSGYGKGRPVAAGEIGRLNLFTAMRRIFNIGTIYISMANTWGDNWALHNVNEDMEMLKKWVEVNVI